MRSSRVPTLLGSTPACASPAGASLPPRGPPAPSRRRRHRHRPHRQPARTAAHPPPRARRADCVHHPDEAAVEETYVNRNGTATLKLGYARAIALLAPAQAGILVAEYGAKTVKMAVVGTGAAEKEQVQMMVRRLLPAAVIRRADAADALAVAICHAHHRASRLAWTPTQHDRPPHWPARQPRRHHRRHRRPRRRLPRPRLHPDARGHSRRRP